MEQWTNRRACRSGQSNTRFHAGAAWLEAAIRVRATKESPSPELRSADALARKMLDFPGRRFTLARTADGRISEERTRAALGAVARGIFREGTARHGISHGCGARER